MKKVLNYYLNKKEMIKMTIYQKAIKVRKTCENQNQCNGENECIYYKKCSKSNIIFFFTYGR